MELVHNYSIARFCFCVRVRALTVGVPVLCEYVFSGGVWIFVIPPRRVSEWLEKRLV